MCRNNKLVQQKNSARILRSKKSKLLNFASQKGSNKNFSNVVSKYSSTRSAWTSTVWWRLELKFLSFCSLHYIVHRSKMREKKLSYSKNSPFYNSSFSISTGLIPLFNVQIKSLRFFCLPILDLIIFVAWINLLIVWKIHRWSFFGIPQ